MAWITCRGSVSKQVRENPESPTGNSESSIREEGTRAQGPGPPWGSCTLAGLSGRRWGHGRGAQAVEKQENRLTRLSLRPSRARRPPIGWTSRKSADAERRGSANIQAAGSERGRRFLFRRRQAATVSSPLHSDPILFITLIPLGCGVCLQVCFLE